MSNWPKSSHTDSGRGGQIAPSVFEQRVARHFSSSGWKLERGKRIKGLEIDIYGVQNNLLAGPRYLIVECKVGNRVTKGDLNHLVRILKEFREDMRRQSRASGPIPVLRAVLAYTGNIVDEDVKMASRCLEPEIRLMRFEFNSS